MYGSLKIGSAFGIPIRLHWTFLLLLVLLVSAVNPVVILALFGSVLLHELGHSLVARSFGIHVVDITFWPLGGMARMTAIPEDPKIEGLIAVAGPAVNYVLAGIGVLGMSLCAALDLQALEASAVWFTVVNLVLGTFNLIPAFPMDGGRLLRAWLARGSDWLTATEQAVFVGRVAAGILLVGSIALLFVDVSVCALPLIAAFVWFAGTRELIAVRLRHGASPIGGVRLATEPPRDAPARWATSPGTPVDEETGARRPATWEADELRGGFTEDQIRDLEKYRGRLRRPPLD